MRRSLALLLGLAALLTITPARLAAQPPLATTPAPGPTNPAAARPAVKLAVSARGMQQVTRAALAAASLDLAATDLAWLRLRSRGAEVPLELRGAGPSAELRFYAPEPGDRWNTAATYWLTAEPPPPQGWARIGTQDAAPVTGRDTRGSARELGAWQSSARYDSTRPGPDGDHWFAAELRAEAGAVSDPLVVTIATALPALGGPITVTVTGSTPASTAPGQTLRATVGGATLQTSWPGGADWSHELAFGSGGAQVTLGAVGGAQPAALLVERVGWDAPVALDLGLKGARFAGVGGRWNYQLTNAPASGDLYDVTEPGAPLRLTGVAGAFSGGPEPRDYLYTGPGTLHTPAAQAHVPVDLGAPMDAEALYIAPAALHKALAPLLAQRAAGGIRARAVAVEAIYDAWGDGQVDPEAIRSFIRYAATAWPTPPRAVTLVGDGSVDPHGYLGHPQPTLIPPYMAPVDPWLGETACDTCYVRVDTADPLADPLPDLLIGRLPAKSEAELRALVAKLVAYEGGSLAEAWRGRLLLVADDPDAAGDFLAAAEGSAAAQPGDLRVGRVFYDPQGATLWGLRSPVAAHDAVRAAWGQGAGIIAYFGHGGPQLWASNSYQPAPGGQTTYVPLLQIYDKLQNGPRLPIVLAMSCLTGAFQTPYVSGMSLDEWLLLEKDGGAVAVWGSSGLGVAYGHEALQRGFFEALWATPPEGARVGELVAAGYRELFAHGTCCQEALFHYVLLGDPLTPARVAPLKTAWLPLVTR